MHQWLLSGIFLLLTVVARGDVILEWNALMLKAIRDDNTSPALSSRNLAILHTAIYDAVNACVPTHQPYRLQLKTPAETSPEAAAAAAAYEVFKVLYPTFRAHSDRLYHTQTATFARDASYTNGLILGQAAGTASLDSRSADGSAINITYYPREEPGQWRRTPPFFRVPLTPHWGRVTPFGLATIVPFVSPPPPALNSAEYAAAVNELKAIGGKDSTVRTAEQSLIATYWSDFSYTAMPPGHWHEIAATIAQNQTNSLVDNARLFALISIAQADAAIVCWETKYRYNFWRPVTAIHRADEDGNPDTAPDTTWNSHLNAPPFPAYTSGHSTFSKASAGILTRFYGTDALTFSTSSDSLPKISRTFHSLAACADEVGQSRIYGGIHFSFDNQEGKRAGAKIAQFISDNFLLPNERLPTLVIDPYTTNGVPSLRLHGQFESQVVLETSDDRVTWSAVYTNSARMGGVAVPAEFGNQAHFLRVRSY